MLDYQGLHAIVDRLDTPLGHFRLGLDGNAYEGPYWLQFVLKAPDATETERGDCGCHPGAVGTCPIPPSHCPRQTWDDPKEWHGRKWRISAHMTTREVLGTALAAVIAAMEHEAREGFKYMGQAVFGPHIPLASLMEGAKAEPDARKPIGERIMGGPDGRLVLNGLPTPCSCAPGVCVERLGGILAGTTFCASRNGQH